MLMDNMRASNPCPVYVLDGSASAMVRQQVINLFKRGGGSVLFATPFFREGIDLPQIDVGVLAGGGLSDTNVLQGLGRVLRPRPDKAEVLWYDFEDGGAETDRPEKDYMAGHSASRLDLYTTQGFQVTR
jgi:superfamily II DNA or RNA helicase